MISLRLKMSCPQASPWQAYCWKASLALLSMGSVAALGSQAAEAAQIDRVSVFVAPGFGNTNPDDLSSWFSSTFLRVDLNQDGGLTADETVSAGTFDAVNQSIDNPNISYSKTGKTYQGISGIADIWRVDYSNLGLSFPTHSTVRFGVKGIGRRIPGSSDWTPGPDYYPWFLLASNAGLSGYGAGAPAFTDDRYVEFNADGSLFGVINSADQDWNKSSDILVQVFGPHGNLVTDRGLPDSMTVENMVRWAPPESIYAYPGVGNTPEFARFKGDDFKAVPTPSLLLGAMGMVGAMVRKRRAALGG